MRCIRPTQFPNAHGFYTSCGQCMPCRITRRSEWATKLLLEWKTFPHGVFVTLTYAPDYLPDREFFPGGSLDKNDLQKFLKRFRKNYQHAYGVTKIRHFAVGEYGDRSKRAHYHVLLFNVDPECAEKIVNKSWTLGITRTDELNENRIKYTVGYTIKKMTSLQDFPDGQVPEFSMGSKNPALGWYSIPFFADLCRKNGLFPSRSVSNEDQWILKKDGFDLDTWNGVFFMDKSGNIEFPTSDKYKPSPGANYHRLDTAMMLRLSKFMSPDLADYVDARRDLFLPETYKTFRSIGVLKSSIDKMHFVGSDEYEQTIKKATKIDRQKSNTKKI